MFAGSGGVTQSPASIIQNVNMENELGTMQKPPKLMSLDEYSGWSGRFKNWVQANHLECWIKIKRKYVPPVDGLNMLKTIASLTEAEQVEFKAEKKMVSILQQAIKEDILVLLQHDDSAQSIWQALEQKFKGSASMIKSKKALIKKEFNIFTGIKGESTKQLIERYCHLVVEMRRLNIEKTNEEWIDKLCDALPYEEWGTVRRFKPGLVQSTPFANTSSAAPNAYQSSQSTPFANYEPNVKVSEQNSPQSSTGSNQQTFVSGVQCNIAVNIQNGNEITENAAKQHIALLASVLEAYEVRRAQRFMEITGRSSLSGPDQKLGFDKSKVTCFKCKERGHFKRECPNREVQNHQNPFTNDYYRQAIYHRPNQQSAIQRPQIENKPEKALIVNQDDEKVASGFSWDKYVPGKDDRAMMAEVVEITETVAEPKVVDEVVTENVGEIVSESVVESNSEVVEEVVTKMVDSVTEIVIEKVMEVADQVVPEVVEKVSTDSSAKAGESVTEFLNFQSRQEEFVYTMKSILPPNVFDSFADYFEEPRTGTCLRFEAEKEAVEEVIDVSKEMTEETLKEIADKALMSKLKEVDSDVQESVDKVSGLGKETGVIEVNVVKSSESESDLVGMFVRMRL
ncbi:uncharacterized protein LOC110908231 [Helianthus annuus]|uniref:uncharacterized protein LOC110908231 n=1 Tax=Helianthus annuus TaxID=4232 RepID=UPI000B90A454|nr:uncharacterized protein LOC110908231 [Helianthus annuus]